MKYTAPEPEKEGLAVYEYEETRKYFRKKAGSL
jgi:hypothetical protein